MAQEQRNPSQTQPKIGPAPSVISPSSPYYSMDDLPKGEIAQPAMWLFERGWKCLGDPAWPTAQWFDPASPSKVEKQEVPCYGYVERLDHADRDAQGRPKLKLVREHLKDQDGTERGNQTVPIMQTVIAHPAAAATLQEAIRMQLNREEAKQKVG